jgi:capsular exopolysaccharide synthesis family protein
MREGSAGPAPADVRDRHADTASSLQQYDREERRNESHVLQEAPPPTIDQRSEPAILRVEPPRPDSGTHHQRIRRAKFTVDGDRRARLVTGTSSAASIEQYRKLAATLHEEQIRSQLKTVIVTSALPGEGKTLTVVNLALTLSESYGKRVLVIDADLRGPALHLALNIANDRGLADALREDQPVSFVAMTSDFAVLPAGNPGPTPLAELTSPRMAQILDECATMFDFVLIDTPPVGVLPDAQVLIRLANAVLFVVGAGTTPAATVERAIAELGGPDAIFGVVLNRVADRQIPAADYYGHYQSPAK